MGIALGAREGEQYLELLGGLLVAARPGALFPDAARLREWLGLFGRPTPKGLKVRLAVHATAGFPERRALARFHTLQRVARAVLEGVRPSREAHAFSAALVNVELPPLERVTARLVGRARGVDRFTVVYDSLDPRSGCPTRFTAQLEQRKAKHLVLDRRDQAQVTDAFAREVAVSCEGRVENALVSLRSLEGLTVTEVVRAQLGPFVAPLWATGAGRDVQALRTAVERGGAVLSLLLDRAGESVAEDKNVDPWRVLDATPAMLKRRAALRYRVALERRLVCTAQTEAAVRALVEGKGVVVRSG